MDELELDAETKKVLLANIRRRLTPQAVKIRAGMCQGYQLDSKKHALVNYFMPSIFGGRYLPEKWTAIGREVCK